MSMLNAVPSNWCSLGGNRNEREDEVHCTQRSQGGGHTGPQGSARSGQKAAAGWRGKTGWVLSGVSMGKTRERSWNGQWGMHACLSPAGDGAEAVPPGEAGLWNCRLRARVTSAQHHVAWWYVFLNPKCYHNVLRRKIIFHSVISCVL